MLLPSLLNRSQIQDQQWDQFIQNSGQRVVYGYSWYLDLVSPGWSALVWPSAEEYQVVMPLPVVRKWGLGVIQQPFFCQYLGLFSASELEGRVTEAFLRVLSQHFRYISSYCFHPDNSPSLAKVLPACPTLLPKLLTTHWLPLNQPYITLKSTYNQDRLKNLKRAEKAGWYLEELDNIAPLIDFFRNFHASQINGGVNEAAYSLLHSLFQQLKEKGLVRLYYAGRDGTLHAGVMLVGDEKKTVYLFNAADETGRRLNGRTYLLDRYFQEKAGTGLVFDFESPGQVTIAEHYQSFGAQEQSFYSIRQNNLPWPLRTIQEWRLKRLTSSS
ncbi:GNAT family N-acetyltransferase [Telluribacter sp.]|jgi:hypothetical protein|uniref:GNAT family N-acetyltransferase n=1 Tax=Telluribacter sp. TaxID=1978767 RepID=UPI002E159EDA|nr:GNAT family N-acetyltransferase [Telluribacter sp.]